MKRRAFRGVTVIIGGLEASLRRFTHYDYWDDKLRRSILPDSKADYLIYGMGERAIVEVADALNSGLAIDEITFLDGTVVKARNLDAFVDYTVLPSYDELVKNKKS